MQKFVKVMLHVSVLFGMYWIGTRIQQAFDLFIPGSVIGLVLLFSLLMAGIVKPHWVDEGAQFVVRHLALFFIPATVGIMNYFGLFEGAGFMLVLIALGSTLVVMVVSGHVSQWLARRKYRENSEVSYTKEEGSHG
ncbi:CidA/LrgA family protein [Virgibacillus xinjiangensis]|uniref:CidA/LrgA family protein n=1 Tax=Virgibacillus xinjiangensis TaxID=393090 RepID=A0ABV7CY99_9BACI